MEQRQRVDLGALLLHRVEEVEHGGREHLVMGRCAETLSIHHMKSRLRFKTTWPMRWDGESCGRKRIMWGRSGNTRCARFDMIAEGMTCLAEELLHLPASRQGSSCDDDDDELAGELMHLPGKPAGVLRTVTGLTA